MRGIWTLAGCRKLVGASPASALPFTQSFDPELADPESVTYPQLVLFTPVHCGWLNTLKASARNSTDFDSRILKRLNTPMSKLRRPGPASELRPESPKVRPVGCV